MQGNLRARVFTIVAVASLLLMTSNVFAAPKDGTKITVIHMNDQHGRTYAEPYISQMAKDMKAKGENVIILDAGDVLHGQTDTNLSKGASMVNVMNNVGYAAMAAGNHDFNFGVDRLLELSKQMDFPVLAANVKYKSTGAYLFKKYTIMEVDGAKVGIFGLATPETVTKSDPRIVKDIVFENPVVTAEAMVKQLKDVEKCDLVIALVHLGVEKTTATENRGDSVASVKGIDLVVDGHSHTAIENGQVIGDALLVQTGALAENIGAVELTFKGNKIEKTAKLIHVPKKDEKTNLAIDEKVVELIQEEHDKNKAITSVVVGKTPYLLNGAYEDVRLKETNLADMITDSMLKASESDVAILSGGNIRANIEPGDITMEDVLTVLPFSNSITSVQMKGSDLLEALELGVSAYPEKAGSHIQVAGLKFEFDPSAEKGKRISTVTMADGTALDPNRSYKVATIDYLAAGGDGYTMFEKSTDKIYYAGDAEAFVAYIKTNPTISEDADTRVVPKQLSATKAPTVAPAQNKQTVTYVVVKGDRLWTIAKKFGTTTDEIFKLNLDIIKNKNLIYPGQILTIKYVDDGRERIDNTDVAQKADQIYTVVETDKNARTAEVIFWKKTVDASSGKATWKKEWSVNGYVGKDGVGQASETVAKTPEGAYRLGLAFGTGDNPGTKAEYKKITPNSWWSSENDETYNTWQESSIALENSEHLEVYPVQYKYSIAINYNTEKPVYGLGSAFFLHCERGGPTGGCVSIPENYMKEAVVDLSDKAYIIIVDDYEKIANY